MSPSQNLRFSPFNEAEWFAGLERTDPEPSPCCASCRRGTKALGLFPCGRDGECGCHR